MTDLVGILAVILSMWIFLPQIYKSYKSKSTKDLSYGFMILYIISHLVWITYGIMVPAWAVVVSDTITVICAGALILLKVHYDGNATKTNNNSR